MKWEWTAAGVKFGDREIAFVPALPEELELFSSGLDLAKAAGRILRQANLAFATGKAEYRNAFENLSNLQDELDKAAIEIDRRASAIDAFFAEPVAGLFDGPQAGFDRFIAEALERLAK